MGLISTHNEVSSYTTLCEQNLSQWFSSGTALLSTYKTDGCGHIASTMRPYTSITHKQINPNSQLILFGINQCTVPLRQ